MARLSSTVSLGPDLMGIGHANPEGASDVVPSVIRAGAFETGSGGRGGRAWSIG